MTVLLHNEASISNASCYMLSHVNMSELIAHVTVHASSSTPQSIHAAYYTELHYSWKMAQMKHCVPNANFILTETLPK